MISDFVQTARRAGATTVEALGRAVAPSSAESPWTVTIARGVDEIEALGPEWRALESDAPSPVLFQSHGWCRGIARALAADGAGDGIRVAALRQAGHLVAILPLGVRAMAGVRVARILGEPLAQYADCVARPGAFARARLPWRAVAAAAGIDVFSFRRVRDGTPLAEALVGAGATLVSRKAAREVPLDGHADVAAFGAAIDPKAARERRRLRRRLAERGELGCRHVAPGADAVAAARLAMAWKHDWLARRGATSAAFSHERWTDALIALVSGPGVDALVTVLELDGRPIAIEIGFRFGGRHHCHLGASDPAEAAGAPGTIAMEEALGRCLADGIAVYDLMGPDEAYKHRWCPVSVPMGEYRLAGTPRGRVAIIGAEMVARPLARAAVERMPTGVSRLLARWSGRA